MTRKQSLKDWGGVICINYPIAQDKIAEVFELLKQAAQSDSHYIISLYDENTKQYYGSPELFYDGGNHVTMIHSGISHDNSLKKIEFTFYSTEVQRRVKNFKITEV